MSAGVDVKGVCVLLPHTADQGKSVRRKLYADALAKQVRLPPPWLFYRIQGASSNMGSSHCIFKGMNSE
jgi:hypothetical protein